jgi:hypothetical protein
MKNLPKALIANFVLFSAILSADSYPSPIHSNGRMPDGTAVYEQNMQSRPPNQDWVYDPAISKEWQPRNNAQQQGEEQPIQGSDQPMNAPSYNR